MSRLNLDIIDPELLDDTIHSNKIRVFLCGPGIKFPSSGSDVRIKMRDKLASIGCEVWLGEHLETNKPKTFGRSDLQTHETKLAHQVDFTVLLLNSPGAFAELGAFAMIPNIASRLYAIVPVQHFNAKSYISRGPLSILTKYSKSNIIYDDLDNEMNIFKPLKFPICFYKFCRVERGAEYQRNVVSHFQGRTFGHNDYDKYINGLRKEFWESATLCAVNILGNPTFAELVGNLQFSPSELRVGLRGLHQAGSIEKTSQRRYRATRGLDDPMLRAFSSGKVSSRKAKMIALA